MRCCLWHSHRTAVTLAWIARRGEGSAHDRTDAWGILGLQPGAAPHEVRIRYHVLLKKYHPDFVPNGESGDMDKWRRVAGAYQAVMSAPQLDMRFRNFVSNPQRMYYRLLSQWMARNLDEMPQYWSWVRLRLHGCVLGALLVGGFVVLTSVIGCRYTLVVACAFLWDCLFHSTLLFPVAVFALLRSVFKPIHPRSE